jgi:hypothetical protein
MRMLPSSSLTDPDVQFSRVRFFMEGLGEPPPTIPPQQAWRGSGAIKRSEVRPENFFLGLRLVHRGL